jgi:hypothetical protein
MAYSKNGIGGRVSKIARRCFVGLPAVLMLAVAIVPAAAGQAQHSSRPHAQPRLAQAADMTSQKGFHAKLPPHISTLLGVAKEEEFPVLQNVVRTGTLVQGFDVSAADKKVIVLFVVDETSNDQSLYLTSPQGTLLKVVSVKAGVGQAVRMTDQERQAFKKEKQFWVDRLVPSSPAK